MRVTVGTRVFVVVLVLRISSHTTRRKMDRQTKRVLMHSQIGWLGWEWRWRGEEGWMGGRGCAVVRTLNPVTN